MKGDFTRDTFSPLQRFTRVLMQQGRVQLDADWNEQTAILLHYLRSLAADLIGPYGGPAHNLAYQITPQARGDFSLSPGHYYVDGCLCENSSSRFSGEDMLFTQQKDLPGLDPLKFPSGGQTNYLVFLDVWERHITHLQEESIREVALGGADTATRASLMTQVKAVASIPRPDDPPDEELPTALPAVNPTWEDWLMNPATNRWGRLVESLQPANRGKLKARGRNDPRNDEVCLASPEARYRGPENQLYRVEVHRPGNALADDSADPSAVATFKWSRENGSVVFRIYQLEGNTAIIEKPRDDRLGIQIGDWVEALDDRIELHGQTGILAEVKEIHPTNDPTQIEVLLMPADAAVDLPQVGEDDQPYNPILRRWDHRPVEDTAKDSAGAVFIREGEWLSLERGVQVWFDPAAQTEKPHSYRTGDYWLIPARTEIEDVLWPGEPGDPQPLPPHGVDHYYAPVAIYPAKDGVTQADIVSLLKTF